MKFQLVINMERYSPAVDMRDLERHTLEMVQMADAGGFAIVWAAEHHALELFTKEVMPAFAEPTPAMVAAR